MNFSNSDKAIYLQIADRICDEIISGKYKDDDRIPSVREYAVLLEVNTNTVVKAYDHLSRGLGFFVVAGAKRQILKIRREEFMKQTLPEVFRQMRLLGIGIEEVVKRFN